MIERLLWLVKKEGDHSHLQCHTSRGRWAYKMTVATLCSTITHLLQQERLLLRSFSSWTQWYVFIMLSWWCKLRPKAWRFRETRTFLNQRVQKSELFGFVRFSARSSGSWLSTETGRGCIGHHLALQLIYLFVLPGIRNDSHMETFFSPTQLTSSWNHRPGCNSSSTSEHLSSESPKSSSSDSHPLTSAGFASSLLDFAFRRDKRSRNESEPATSFAGLSNIAIEELEKVLEPIVRQLQELDAESLLHLTRVPNGGARLKDGYVLVRIMSAYVILVSFPNQS